ncbi:hypothetical protein HAX54_019218 [Datura stramonium]|uniref:Uncharacterized protein n=1 Tax=Datura stramonium TaxID=4076 RepID=A0ABS8UNR1_DATST|nr:hypothetical protein [Datura stramonium]
MAPKPSKGKGVLLQSMVQKGHEELMRSKMRIESSALEFAHIVDRLYTLGLDFVLNDPGECNLNMVLNRILGSPSIDLQLFNNLILRPPYREIWNTLSGPNFITWSARHQ